MIKKLLSLPLLILIIGCGAQSETDNQEENETEEGLTIIDEKHEQGEFVSTFDSCEALNMAEFYPELMGESELETYSNYLENMNLEENFYIKGEYSFDSLGIYLYISYNQHLTKGLLAELKGEEKFLEIDIRPMNGQPISAGRYEVDTDLDVEMAMFVVYMEDGTERLKYIGNDMGLTYLTINKHQEGHLCGNIEFYNMGDELTKKISFDCKLESFSLQ